MSHEVIIVMYHMFGIWSFMHSFVVSNKIDGYPCDNKNIVDD
jgi:hypothetical protein